MRRRWVGWVVGGVAVVVVAVVGVGVLVGPVIVMPQSIQIDRRKAQLLQTDPAALRAALDEVRAKAAIYPQDPSWNNVPPGSARYPDPASLLLPPLVRSFRPSSIIIDNDGTITLEMGGGFLHYGVRCLPPGTLTPGEYRPVNRELIDRLWYYAEDEAVATTNPATAPQP